MTKGLKSVSLSEKGPVRSLNADAVLADDKAGFYAVADGVGSSASSAQASAFAVSEARKIFSSIQRDAFGQPDLLELVDLLVGRFKSKFSKLPALPSTTLTVAAVSGQTLNYVSVGDSPAFLIVDQSVKLLTRDHTVVDRGRIISDFSVMKAMGGSHILYNTIGPWPTQPILYPRVTWTGSSRLVVCSDGFLELFSQTELSLLFEGSLAGIAEKVRVRSTRVKAPDNYTAIAVALPEQEAG